MWYFVVLVGFWGALLLALATTDSSRLLWVVFWILTLACLGLIIGAWVLERPYQPGQRAMPYEGSTLTDKELAEITTVVSMAPSIHRMRKGETGLHTLMAQLPSLRSVWLIACQEDKGQRQQQKKDLNVWLVNNLPGSPIKLEVMPSPKISRYKFNHRQVLAVSRQLRVWKSQQPAGLWVDISADTKITSVELWLAAFYSGLPVMCQITEKPRVADDDLAADGDGRSAKRNKRAEFNFASATFRALPTVGGLSDGDEAMVGAVESITPRAHPRSP